MQPLTASDCREIYYSLESKRNLVRDLYNGQEDHERREQQDWIEHLGDVLAKIGPDGTKLYAALQDKATPLENVFETTIPQLYPATNDVNPNAAMQRVVIRNIGDGLTIEVPGFLFLTIEKLGHKVQLFVGKEDGDDEVCVVGATRAGGDTRIKVHDVGGFLLTDSADGHENYGPLEWFSGDGRRTKFEKMDERHLVNVLCMLQRIARFFGNDRPCRMRPACYKSLVEEAERRGLSSSRWLNSAASQAEFDGGVEKRLRSRYYVKAAVTGHTAAEVHERLGLVCQLVVDREVHFEETGVAFSAVYPPEDEPDAEQVARERVIQLGNT